MISMGCRLDSLLFKKLTALVGIVLLSFCFACSKTNSADTYTVPSDVVLLDTCVAEVYGNADSIVTIISDDGFFETGVYLNAMMKYSNLHASVAGIVYYVDPFIDEWKDMVDEGHIELINHSYNHKLMKEGSFITYNYFALRHEVIDSDKYYETNLGKEQIVFIWPENAMSQNGYSMLINNGFWASRGDQRGFNSLSPEDGCEDGQWYCLRIFGIKDDGVDTDVRNSWVDQAINEKLWLIEMWHGVLDEDDGKFQTITIEEAAGHLKYLSSKTDSGEVWNPTFTDAVKYIREKQNSSVYAYVSDGKMHLYVELTDPDMSYETFNHPLTVGVRLSSENDLVYYDVIPGKELIIELDG